jgi:putative ABC transport system permease protein
MLAALKPIRTGANITVREAISTYGLGGASTFLEKFLAKFKTFPELLALMLSNTFRNRQRAILIMVTLIISGVIFMTVISLGASMSYTYDDLLRMIYKFDVTFSFVDRQRINRIEAVTLDHPSAEMVEMWNVTGAAARPISQAEKSINDKTVQVLGVPVPTALYGPDVREGRWLEPEDTYAVVLNQRMAWELEANLGDMLTFDFGPKGESDWQVVGIAFDPVLIASAHVPRDTLERELGGKADTVFIKLKPGYDPAATAPELRDHYEANGLRVSTTTIFFTVDTLQQMIEMAELEISTLIALLSAMAVMMAIVGSIGLGSVLAINVLERRREIGVMRAIGASNKIISKQLIGEGLTLGMLSWLIAVPLSIPASWLMNFALGWTMKIEFTFIFSFAGVFYWLVITLVLSVSASWLPARRAVSVSVRESLAYQ